MKIRTLIVIVIMLLIVNVAALATMVYYRVAPHPDFEPRPRFGEGFEPPALDPETKKRIELSRKMTDSLLEPIRVELDSKRKGLVNELDRDNPDTARVNQLLDELGSLQTSMQKQMISQFLKDRDSFGPEQRRKILRMIEERSRWQQRGMMGGPRMERDRNK